MPVEFDQSLAQAHLRKIRESPAFQKSPRRRDLLTWLVHEALANPGAEISERTIAAEVYGRAGDFDPTQDAIVRVEMSRLRSNLESFYTREGRDEGRISIPKGSYVPTFQFAVEPEIPVAAMPPTDAPRPVAVSRKPWRLAVVACLVAIFVILFAISPAALRTLRGRSSLPEFLPVTALPGRHLQPSLSPDGSRLAYSWDGASDGTFRVFTKLVNRDEVTPLTSGTAPTRSPAWSPDGKSIAFLRTLPNLDQEVRLIPANGGAERLLTTIQTNVVGIAWTPDSLNLIVPDSPPGKRLALFLVSLATGERHQLTEFGSYFEPAISPDGRTLAFVTDTAGNLSAIILLPLGPDFLPAGPARMIGEPTSNALFWPTWSPDSRSLIYAKQTSATWSLYRVSVDGSPSEPLPGPGSGVVFGQEYSPGRFVLIRHRERDFLARVAPRTESRHPAPLFQSLEQDFDSTLSPDGSQIAFHSHRGGHRGLWVANRDGTEANRVEVPGDPTTKRPSWTPDGRNLYFWGIPDRAAPGKSRIFQATVQSAPMKAGIVPLDDADNANPVLSHDGRWLYFTSNRSGSFQICRAPLAGGRIEPLSPPIPGNNIPVGEESFDGQYLFYTSPSGIWRLSLKNRQTALYLPVGFGGIRMAPDGVYYDTATSIAAGLVNFRPFASASPELTFALGQHHGWSPIPGSHALIGSLVQVDSNVELYTPR